MKIPFRMPVSTDLATAPATLGGAVGGPRRDGGAVQGDGVRAASGEVVDEEPANDEVHQDGAHAYSRCRDPRGLISALRAALGMRCGGRLPGGQRRRQDPVKCHVSDHSHA